MKRVLVIGVLVLLAINFAVPFVSAQSFDFEFARYNIARAIQFVLGLITPVLEIAIGEYYNPEHFLTTALLLILLIIIIAKVLEGTPIVGKGRNKGKIAWIISTLVSVIGIRFIVQNQLFQTVFIQYGVLGIAITTVLPLIIFFYFIHKNKQIGNAGRRVAWAIYAIALFALWIVKAGNNELSPAGEWIYILSFLAAILFLVFDKTIHGYLGLNEIRGYRRFTNKHLIRDKKKELDELREHFQNHRITWNEYNTERREIENQIRELSRDD